jgi:hypothetical protein
MSLENTDIESNVAVIVTKYEISNLARMCSSADDQRYRIERTSSRATRNGGG